MPSIRSSTEASFDNGLIQIQATFRRLGFGFSRAPKSALCQYQVPRPFIVGWDMGLPICGETLVFRLLVDQLFPYSPIRIAIISRKIYRDWPHVEEHGLLCLPNRPPPALNISQEVEAAIFYATELAERCMSDRSFVEQQFGDEFVSYWSRSVTSGPIGAPFWSLIDIQNTNSRAIWTENSNNCTIVADRKETLKQWLEHAGIGGSHRFEKGLFGHLAHPPIPPFPDSVNELRELLSVECTSSIPLLDQRLASGEPFSVVLGATAESGVGLVGLRFALQDNREIKKIRGLSLWERKGIVGRSRVNRIDASWVHGRDQNVSLGELAAATISVIGCGSLGSHVAVRLAQLGVGNLILVDYDILEASNVGRHVLGIRDVGKLKSPSLAKQIGQRFPHIKKVSAFDRRWENLYPDQLLEIMSSNLIISCMGDHASETILNQWLRNNTQPKTIYGWLEEDGCAAHALLTTSQSPCFSCVINSDGSVREPETSWPPGLANLRTEPACGTQFQPFGPLAVADAEALICKLAIDVLTGRINASTHRIHVVSTAEVEAAGGEWSASHRSNRPSGFDGAFDYTKVLERSADCEVCNADS